MKRLFFPSIFWVLLEILLLNTVGAILSPGSFLPQSSHAVPTFAQAHADDTDGLLKKSDSASQELSLQCKRQSQRTLSFAYSSFLSSAQEQGEHRPSILSTPPIPVCFVFPRKLSPPSATDDPFMS